MRFEKILRSKIVHIKKIYKFDVDHFQVKCTFFVLIEKNVIKNQKFNFSVKLCDIRKNVNKKKLLVSKRSFNFLKTKSQIYE